MMTVHHSVNATFGSISISRLCLRDWLLSTLHCYGRVLGHLELAHTSSYYCLASLLRSHFQALHSLYCIRTILAKFVQTVLTLAFIVAQVLI